MSLNNQSRSLIAISKMQGWDPTKLEGKPIEGLNSMPTIGDNSGKTALGSLPGGAMPYWPDGYDSEHPQVQTTAATPIDWTGNDKDSMTVGPFRRRAAATSDTFAGKGGTAL
jgi:hypothetical protein